MALAGLAEGAGSSYFIAAEEVEWDYAPSGKDLCKDSEDALEGSSKFRKAAFVEYTDGTFKASNQSGCGDSAGCSAAPQQHPSAWRPGTELSLRCLLQVKKPKAADMAHTGLLGPVIRASVGESLGVTLLNRLSFPVNIAPSGLQGAADGADAAADFAPAAEPGGTASYAWSVPAAAALPAGEAGAKFWLYQSTVDIEAHANAGLLGGVLVTAQPRNASAAEPGSGAAPVDVITIFQVVDESKSPFHGEGMEDMGVHDLSTHWHAINGYVWCNLPQPEAEQGQR